MFWQKRKRETELLRVSRFLALKGLILMLANLLQNHRNQVYRQSP
jgi:hypothetical protein